MTMSKISENGLFGQKKAPAGWFHSKTKVVNTFPNIPDPIRTKLYLKIAILIANSLKIDNFRQTTLKKKNVAKAKLRLRRTLGKRRHAIVMPTTASDVMRSSRETVLLTA